MPKTTSLLLGVERFKKCTRLWREARFKVKLWKWYIYIYKSTPRSDHFWTFEPSFSGARAMDFAPCQKWAECEGLVAVAKTMAGVKKICKDACRMAGAVRETSSSVSALMSRDGLHFGASFRLNMISRGRCSPSYDLASLFHGRRSTLDRWHGKNAKRVAASSAQPFIFEESRAELLRFCCCQLRFCEEVWENFFVLELWASMFWESFAFEINRRIDRQTSDR